MPRILFINHSGQLGGAELSLKELVLPYIDESLVLLLEDGPFREVLQNSSVACEIETADLSQIKTRSGPALTKITEVLRVAKAIADRSSTYDIICTNTQKSGVIGMLSGFLSRRPVLIFIRDILSEEHFSFFNRSIFVQMSRFFANKVLVNSSATGKFYTRAGGVANKVRLVYPGFNIDAIQILAEESKQALKDSLNIKADVPIIGCFSRIAPWKGQHILLSALSHIDQPLCLVICGAPLFGEDSWLAELKERASHLNHQVIFTGFRNDVSSLMQICDIVVNPSSAPEPFGRTTAEAQLLSLPVIASGGGGAEEIIDNDQTGLLVAPNDESALAKALSTFISDPHKAKEMGKRAQESARLRFCSKASQASFAAVLKEVLDQ